METNETGQGPSDETTDTGADRITATEVLANQSPAIEAPAEVIGEPHTPTREEAREMFKANPGLWAVLTTEGNMTRDEA